MAETSRDYIFNLMRRKTSGENLSVGEQAYLSRYEHELDASDHEPHRISRSQTLEILGSVGTQRILASH